MEWTGETWRKVSEYVWDLTEEDHCTEGSNPKGGWTGPTGKDGGGSQPGSLRAG